MPYRPKYRITPQIAAHLMRIEAAKKTRKYGLSSEYQVIVG